MPLQKRRLGKHRVRSRRSAWMGSFAKPTLQACPNCGSPKQPHRVCASCGQYRGQQVMAVESEDNE